MVDTRTVGYAAFLLRLLTGVFFLVHASIKLFVFTPAGTAGYFGSLGLPPALAYFIIILEIAGGLALVLGIWARIVAIVMAIELLGTIYAVHWAAGFVFTNANGGWEYSAFGAVTLVALALIGDGPYALKATPALNG
jgi:putative oxidoreductase